MRDDDDMAIDDRAPFVPCVMVFDDPKRTEIVLADAVIVWVYHGLGVELGYDADTDELVAVRIDGDVSKRDTRHRVASVSRNVKP